MTITPEQHQAIKLLLLFAEQCQMLNTRYTCKRGTEIIGEHVRLLVTSTELTDAMKVVDSGLFEQCEGE